MRDSDMTETPSRVRILCQDAKGALLLMKWRDPVEGRIFWEPPGGGVEPGETSREAAARELYEETGLRLELSPASILVERRYRWAGRDYEHIEEFFLAFAHEPSALSLHEPTEQERLTFLGCAFLSPGELAHLADPVDPPGLPELLARLSG